MSQTHDARPWLIVEDEPITALMFEDTLRHMGESVLYPVMRVHEAIVIAQATPLAGAVLDINVGRDTVFPLAAALRAQGVSFVFVTARDADSVPAAFGAYPILRKPISPEQLRDALIKLSAGRARPA